MKTKRNFLLSFSLVLPVFFVVAQSYRNPKYDAYIERFSPIAVEKMYQYGIPASITLAQGILESGIGESRLALEAKNHFGIKCHDWKGDYVLHTDDKVNECFRKYNNPEESYEDHSLFLTSRVRYAHLFQLRTTDYKAWASGLQRAGYATDPNYATRLVALIESNDLHVFDKQSRKSSDNPVFVEPTHNKSVETKTPRSKSDSKRYPARASQRNMYGLRYVIATTGDSYSSIAQDFKVSLRSIVKWNDLPQDVSLREGEIVYLQKKKKKVTNYSSIHYVQEGESMHAISQRYGIQLQSLYDLNNLPYSQSPTIGQKLYLK